MTDLSSAASTQIHNLGYRPYDGARSGVAWSVRCLAVHSFKQALGLKRSGRHKIAPGLTLLFAYLPALGMAAFAAVLGAEMARDIARPGEYLGTISFALFLFTAAVAPGVVTADRTNGMLALYLASPLTRSTYVLAKAIGLFFAMLLITVGPLIFLTLGLMFAGVGPDDFTGFVEAMARAIGAGVLTALFFTAFGFFVSSFPRRWGVASVAIVGTGLVPAFAAGTLEAETEATDWLALMSFPQIVQESGQRIMDSDIWGPLVGLDARSSSLLFLLSAIVIAVLAAGTWWQYQHIEVER